MNAKRWRLLPAALVLISAALALFVLLFLLFGRASAAENAQLPKPTGLSPNSTIVSKGYVTLTWGAVNGTSVYEVAAVFPENGGFTFITHTTTHQNQLVISTTVQVTHTWQVRALPADPVNDSNSEWSSAEFLVTGTAPITVTPPALPSNFRVITATLFSATMGWDDNATNEDGYRLYKWDGVGYRLYKELPTNTTQYSVDNMQCGQVDFYLITVFNSAAEKTLPGALQVSSVACPDPDPVDNCPSFSTTGAIFFEHWLCYGFSFEMKVAGQVAQLPAPYDNAFSSVKLAEGKSVRIYRDANFQGPSVCIMMTTLDFQSTFYPNGENASDNVTSVKFFSNPTCDEAVRIYLPTIAR